jgi:hypothetical protein
MTSAAEQERMYSMTASQQAAGVVTGCGEALVKLGFNRMDFCFASVSQALTASSAAVTDSW